LSTRVQQLSEDANGSFYTAKEYNEHHVKRQLTRVEHDQKTSFAFKYHVMVNTPDNCFVFLLSQVTEDGGTVVIVDEVGKMELFSHSFISLVRELFLLQQATILATVPLTKQRPISFVDELKNRKDVTLIEVRCPFID